MLQVVARFLTAMMKHDCVGELEIIDDHTAKGMVANPWDRLNNCGVINPRCHVPHRRLEKWECDLLLSLQFGFIVLTTSSGITDREEARRRPREGNPRFVFLGLYVVQCEK